MVLGTCVDCQVFMVQLMAPTSKFLNLETIFPEDYYYHKKRGYSIVIQAIVDSKKNFLIFLLTCQVALMILESYASLHYIGMLKNRVYLILEKVYMVFHCIYWVIGVIINWLDYDTFQRRRATFNIKTFIYNRKHM